MPRVDTLAIPEDLTPQGRAAARVIIAVLKAAGVKPSERVFYSPSEWRARGEAYGKDSLLIVLHEASDHAPFFSLDSCYRTGAASDYAPYEAMQNRLSEDGLWFETCTRWYSAIYS